MSGGVDGDWSRLARMIRELGSVRALKTELTASVKQGVDDAYVQQFATASSSTGAAWKPNKQGTPTLARTFALASARSKATAGRSGSLAEARLAPRVSYARYYVDDPRRILPRTEAELGRFGDAVERDVPAVLRRWLEEAVR